MRTLALAALLLATACGKPLLYAEVEIPSATIQVPQQVFPAITTADVCTAPGSGAANRCAATIIQYDLGQDFRDLIQDAHTVDLRLTELAIDLTSTSIANFDNVVRVVISAEGRDATTPAVELARYERDPAAPSATAIAVAARSTINLGSYVQAGFIGIRAELEVGSGGLPEFTADVTGDFYLLVTLDWGKKAGL